MVPGHAGGGRGKLTTPVLDFVRAYAGSNTARLHMPGHKGRGPLGCESVDITEISGADDLACPEGIIAESEANAAELFGSRATLYSTGGSSQCVKAMLLLCARRSKSRVILAARNVHKSFVHACALLDLHPAWLYGSPGASLCSCHVTPDELRAGLDSLPERPAAVYITSPDYLGGMQDVSALAAVAHAFGVPLIADNAHGAYLRFLHERAHPLELGADMCCDSAHKTLGVLTGGAYLHVSRESAWDFERDAREALGVFGSSSPSYLVMASLDAMNLRLAGPYRAELAGCAESLCSLRAQLSGLGVPVEPSDPLRLTVAAFRAGYSGYELAGLLRGNGAEPEFADPDWLALMFTPDSRPEDYGVVLKAFADFRPRAPRRPCPPPPRGIVDITPGNALLLPRESIPAARCAGRVAASAAVSCPPAVPIAVMGERLTERHAELLAAYGIDYIDVVCEK